LSPLKLVIKNVTRNRSRFLLTLLGITVGIASLVTLLSLGSSLEHEVRQQANLLGANLVVTPRGWCAYEQIAVLTGEQLPEAIAAEDVDKISAIQGITAVPYLTERSAIANSPVPVVGILPVAMKEFKGWQVEKGAYLIGEENDSIVVGHGLEEQFGLTVGGKIKIRGREFSIKGILAETGTNDDMYIIAIEEVANVSVISDKQLLNSVLSIIGTVGNTLRLIAAVAVLAACFGIANTMTMTVYERKREIGILKAIGSKNRSIFSIFLLESITYGIIGGILGLLVGFIFTFVASPYLVQNEFTAFLRGTHGMELQDIAVIVLQTLAFSTGISAISGLYAARRAARLVPVEAIRYG
jgi:putative ABC transport system permease protein